MVVVVFKQVRRFLRSFTDGHRLMDVDIMYDTQAGIPDEPVMANMSTGAQSRPTEPHRMLEGGGKVTQEPDT